MKSVDFSDVTMTPRAPLPGTTRQPAATTGFTRVRASLAVLALLTLACLAWLLNGYATVLLLASVAAVPAAYGWLAHAGLTLIELAWPGLEREMARVNTPFSIRLVVFLVVLLFGVFDALSTSVLVAAIVPALPAWGAGIAGSALAIVPEPVIVALVRVLWRMVR